MSKPNHELVDTENNGHSSHFPSDGEREKNEKNANPKRPITFSRDEKFNIILYIIGIMFFKFAFESLNQSVSLIAQNRFPKSIALTMTPVLTSCFNVAQAIFAIGGAQLLARFRTNMILAVSMFSFGFLALLLIIIDASTGGKFKHFGSWTPWLLFPIFVPMGGCLGAIELLRRVIPRDIVGEDPNKLKRMDATVHIFYEVAGTAGAFTTTATIESMGPVYALILLPIMFTFSGLAWIRIKHNPDHPTDLRKGEGRRRSVFYLYIYSVKRGAQIIFSERRFIWLVPGYVLPLILHRIIENVIFPTFANKVLHKGSYSGILLGGSNLGELFGALFVLIFTRSIRTPLPWIRLDGITLMILWVFPFMPGVEKPLLWVLCVFPLMMLLSAGWAAGDVSLVAYIQSRLRSVGMNRDEGTSPLGCVMAFLYSGYILGYTALSVPMGRVMDDYNNRGKIREAFIYVAGVFATISGVIIFLSTFIPRGSFALNPKGDPEDDIAEEEKVESGTPGLVEAISGI